MKLTATKGQDTVEILSIQMLKPLLSLINYFNQTDLFNQRHYLGNVKSEPKTTHPEVQKTI